jgi:TPR repeat protein
MVKNKKPARDDVDPAEITVMADNLTKPGHSAGAFRQAERLYRQAFRLGYDTAAENLAATYLNRGRHREAVQWFRRAHTAGSPTASLEIARAELYGIGTRRNVRAAFAKLKHLADQRLGWNTWLRVEAMQIMADALINGWLITRDYNRGEALLRRAATLEPTDNAAC